MERAYKITIILSELFSLLHFYLNVNDMTNFE